MIYLTLLIYLALGLFLLLAVSYFKLGYDLAVPKYDANKISSPKTEEKRFTPKPKFVKKGLVTQSPVKAKQRKKNKKVNIKKKAIRKESSFQKIEEVVALKPDDAHDEKKAEANAIIKKELGNDLFEKLKNITEKE